MTAEKDFSGNTLYFQPHRFGVRSVVGIQTGLLLERINRRIEEARSAGNTQLEYHNIPTAPMALIGEVKNALMAKGLRVEVCPYLSSSEYRWLRIAFR